MLAGVVGTCAIAARPLDQGLVRYVLEHPSAMFNALPKEEKKALLQKLEATPTERTLE